MALQLRLSPIVERELRVASRKPGTYWARLGAGSVGAAVALWLMTLDQNLGTPFGAGLFAFRTLAVIAGSVLLSGTLQLASATIARERREETLGLLFLTPLSHVEIVASKMVSACIGSFYRFLALVPLLAFTMLSGGVSLGSFLWLVVSLVHLVFLAAALGLFLSTRSRDENSAMTSTTVYYLGLLLISPALAMLIATQLKVTSPEYVLGLSPAFPAYQALFPGIGDWRLACLSLLWTQALGWGFLIQTYRRLPHCWQQRTGSLSAPRSATQAESQMQRPILPVLGALRPSRSFRLVSPQTRQRLLDENPIRWLAERSRAPSVRTWIIVAIAFVGCLSSANDSFEALLSPRLGLFLCFCLHAALKSYVLAQTSHAFGADQHENSLQLLLYAPVTPVQLIDGHLNALKRLRPTLLKLIAAEILWLSFTIGRDIQDQPYRLASLLYPSLVVMAVFVPDLYAAAWSGLRQSVLRPNAAEASRQSFNEVMVMPWILTLGAWAAWGMVGGGRFFGSLTLISVFYLVASLLLDGWVIHRARRALPSLIPLAAARRSEDLAVSEEGWRVFGRRLGRWWAKRNLKPSRH